MYMRPEEPTMHEYPQVETIIIPEDDPVPENIREAAWIVAVALHRKRQLTTPLTRFVKRSELTSLASAATPETKPKIERADGKQPSLS